MKHMLVRVGWKGDFVEKCVPIVPISGWMGDNLITKSTNMGWWDGVEVSNLAGKKIKVTTLLDALNDFAEVRGRLKSWVGRVFGIVCVGTSTFMQPRCCLGLPAKVNCLGLNCTSTLCSVPG